MTDEYSFLKKILFIYFLEREEGREKERERNISVWLPLTWPPLRTWPATQACALTGNWTCDPLLLSRCSIHWATAARADEYSCYSQRETCPIPIGMWAILRFWGRGLVFIFLIFVTTLTPHAPPPDELVWWWKAWAVALHRPSSNPGYAIHTSSVKWGDCYQPDRALVRITWITEC